MIEIISNEDDLFMEKISFQSQDKRLNNCFVSLTIEYLYTYIYHHIHNFLLEIILNFGAFVENEMSNSERNVRLLLMVNIR